MEYSLPPLPTNYPKCGGNDGFCEGTLIPFYVFDAGTFEGFAWKCEKCGKEVRM